jgi:predicted metal-dependent hydrolase
MTYTLTRSRRKTLAIHIKPDGTVEVRAPLWLAKREIERFIDSKMSWIEMKQTQIAARQTEKPRELLPSQYKPGEFEQVTRELVKTWEQRLGVITTFIGIRSMSSRWGSCTAKTRRIRLNALLSYCPRECLEYVIVHELAHLRENNHSPHFWAIVNGVLPDYKARQKLLKTMSWLLKTKTDVQGVEKE